MLTVKLKEDEVSAVLARLAAHLTDMSDVMNELGEQLEYETEQRFNEGVAPDGTPWAAKSPSTIEAYQRRKLRVDFRPLFGPNTDGTPLRDSFFRNYGADFVEIGTNKIQAAVMQFGAKKGAFGADKAGHPIPWGNIPARPFLGISETDRSNITATVSEWLQRVADE